MIENIDTFLDQEIKPKKIKTKKCNRCHEIKPITEFRKIQGYFLTQCKKCELKKGLEIRQKYKKINKNRNPYNNNKKQCTVCKKWKIRSKENWYAINSNKDGLNFRCKECEKKIKMISKYKITKKQHNYILKKQKNRCKICGKKLENPYIDHNHKTGEIRGLLCQNCNSGIGHLKDNPFILFNAIKYLEENK